MELPTVLVALTHDTLSADDIESRLRNAATPVIARIHDGRVLLDVRTVAADEDAEVVKMLGKVNGKS